MLPEISDRLQQALKQHQAGNLAEAEACYRSVLEAQDDNADALHLLGVLHLQTGRPADAVPLIEKALVVKPDVPEFLNSCGDAYSAVGDYDRAIERFEQALSLRGDFAGAHNNLGNALKKVGRLSETVRHYEAAIAADPNFPMPHNNLGVVLREKGDPDTAARHFRRAVELFPAYAEAHSNLGNALLDSGHEAEAIACHERALSIRPDYAEAHSNLGTALRAAGRTTEAIASFRESVRLRPDFAMGHYNLGVALDEQGRPREAIEAYSEALRLDPKYAAAHHNLGNALDEAGRRDEAVSHYRKAIAIKPDYAEAYRNLSRLDADSALIDPIERVLAIPETADIDVAQCHFALGNIYHELGEYDTAFEHYSKGNAIKRQLTTYDADEYSDFVDRLIDAYSADFFDQQRYPGAESEMPVFVVGMPRSGTSLVEQILSSHPQVYGAGELPTLGKLEHRIAKEFASLESYPACIRALDDVLIRELAGDYLAELQRHSTTQLRVTDKMPDNYRRIGLIKLLFPRARIVHCRRDALDTCTSNYLNYFAHGNEYSFDLEDLGRHFLDYERLMAYWKSLFSKDIFDLRYEELVDRQEATSRAMIDFVDLKWDPVCLEFYRTERAVNPFSSRQVRQPIYKNAVGRWKAYEKHLEPLIDVLQGDSR